MSKRQKSEKQLHNTSDTYQIYKLFTHLEVVIEYSVSSTTTETEIKEINSDYRITELEFKKNEICHDR